MAKSVASTTPSTLNISEEELEQADEIAQRERERQFIQYTQKLIIIASILVAVIAFFLYLGEIYNKYYASNNSPQMFQRDPEEIKKDVASYAAVLAGQVGLNTTSA